LSSRVLRNSDTEPDEGGPSDARSDDEEDPVVSEEERRGSAPAIVRLATGEFLNTLLGWAR